MRTSSIHSETIKQCHPWRLSSLLFWHKRTQHLLTVMSRCLYFQDTIVLTELPWWSHFYWTKWPSVHWAWVIKIWFASKEVFLSLCFLWDSTFFEINAGAQGHQPWTHGEYRGVHLLVDIFGSPSLSTNVLSFCILPKELFRIFLPTDSQRILSL